MLGDEEHPISFAFEPRLEGGHVKVVVRAGLRGMRGLAGELTFRPEEWAVLDALLPIIEDRTSGTTNLRSETWALDDDTPRTVYIDEHPIDVASL